MPAISPAINIGIGRYGSVCVSDLAENFSSRESLYTSYVSFHQLSSVDGIFAMNSYDFNTQDFQESKINNIESESEDWRLHNYISFAYNNLITLTQQLNLNVNYDAIHINLIFGAFEVEHLELLQNTIKLIDRLKNQGEFGEVRVKCFSILSEGNGVSTSKMENIIVQTLDSLVVIRSENNVFSHNFILDDKNTQAVSLKVENNYLAFAISEIIVALIRDEYKILGALHNPIGVFSIGLGMVYFDEHYFNVFLENRILRSKINIEKIHNKETKISTIKYSEVVKESIKPYIDGEIDLNSLLTNMRDIIDPEKFGNTMRCYEFLLANLLGLHDRIQLVEPIDVEELYSIDDVIYQQLYQNVITRQQKSDESLLDVKSFKKKVAEYEAEIQEDSIDNLTPELEAVGQDLRKHRNAVLDKIKYYISNFRRKNIALNPELIEDLDSNLNSAEDKKRKIDEDFNGKNFIIKFFSRSKYKSQLEGALLEIEKIKFVKDQQRDKSKTFISDLDRLYEMRSELKKNLEVLDSGISQIHSLKEKYQEEVNKLEYLDYEFLQNIISPEKLKEYESTHREKLQTNINDVLKVLYRETSNEDRSFVQKLDEKIKKQTADIIDFQMSSYLLNKYGDMDLLEKFDFVSDINRLKQRAFPFFNAVPTYSHQSHYLKYFNNANSEETSKIQKLLEDNYTGSIPTYIHTESANKFALITIEMINDLKSIVKYNNGISHEQAN